MPKYTCVDGDDCPCYQDEKSRPLPVVTEMAPIKITVEAGKSAWLCMCGQSAKYPYCDGAHKAYNEANGTKLAPIKVEAPADAPKDFWVCGCGHSKNRPFCDGSHKKVKEVSA